jgi:signal transduction histidine kinase
VAIKFIDNGPGIPKQKQEHIFKPFYSNRVDGTGLGLTISSRIVESYGGEIKLDQNISSGACFIVYLPLETTA